MNEIIINNPMVPVLLLSAFVLGYAAIASEHVLKINKAATAMVTGVISWAILAVFTHDKLHVAEALERHLGELSGILFFLLGAMTIVELIDVHDGFALITSRINQTGKRKLLWIISLLTFFLSAVLDNLTTTIVILSLLRKLIRDDKYRLFFAGIVIIAANAGGAWSPIGDVTTTMLWIGGQVTAGNIIIKLLIPSLICLAVPLIILSFSMKGKISLPAPEPGPDNPVSERTRITVFMAGVLLLMMVPVFKTFTHLPPYMGMLLGLGILWIVTETLHNRNSADTRRQPTVVYALKRIDTPSILFFLGILLSVAALQTAGVLSHFSRSLSESIQNQNVLVILFGLLSSVIDNVPLVAATQGMFSLNLYPPDHYFWEFLAYCTGTGGSILVIGSAAGVAAMGMEKISFFWYLKKISLLALIGYFAGALAYIAGQSIFN